MKIRQLFIFTFFFISVIFVWQNIFAAPQLTNLYKKAKSSVVVIEALDAKGNSIAAGSGFYIGDGKKIVTNSHVIETADTIKVIGSDGHEKKVRHVSYVSKEKDLAVISLYEPGAPLAFANNVPEVGESVVTIGNPRGLESTLSTGIISGIRNISGVTLIQTTTPISPGSSGGPLMNIDGEVIGITTFYLKESQNVNFAVSVSDLKSVRYGKEELDYLSPVSVADEFFKEISENNLEAAILYVLPDEQETFFQLLHKEGIPKFPSGAQLYGEITVKKENGLPSAEVGFVGFNLGVDLVLKFNRWWIVH